MVQWKHLPQNIWFRCHKLILVPQSFLMGVIRIFSVDFSKLGYGLYGAQKNLKHNCFSNPVCSEGMLTCQNFFVSNSVLYNHFQQIHSVTSSIMLINFCPDGRFQSLRCLLGNKPIGCNESKRLPECIEDYFLVQILDRQTRGKVLLGLGLTGEDELTKEVNIGGGMRCSNYALLEFEISRNMDLA